MYPLTVLLYNDVLYTFTVRCLFGLHTYVYVCMKYLQKNTSKRLFIYMYFGMRKIVKKESKKNLTASFKAQFIVATVLKAAEHVTLRIFLIIISYYYYKEILFMFVCCRVFVRS